MNFDMIIKFTIVFGVWRMISDRISINCVVYMVSSVIGGMVSGENSCASCCL